MNGPHVMLEGVSKNYAGIPAVCDVNLSIDRGEFVVLLGPSGSGKTTLLSILGGFVEPTSGRVLIGGNDVTRTPPARRPTSTVFQDYALFPHMNVAGNIAFGLEMQGLARRDRISRVSDVLAMVGLAGFERRPVGELSGGQRQRVALARAIAVRPEVLLLDEPLGALDLNLRRQMQDELVGLQRSLGTTFVHVTHDQEEGMSIADRIVVLNNGRVEDSGSPDRVYLEPATLFAATFMGETNIVEGRVEEASDGHLSSRRRWAESGCGAPRRRVTMSVSRSGRNMSSSNRPAIPRAWARSCSPTVSSREPITGAAQGAPDTTTRNSSCMFRSSVERPSARGLKCMSAAAASSCSGTEGGLRWSAATFRRKNTRNAGLAFTGRWSGAVWMPRWCGAGRCRARTAPAMSSTSPTTTPPRRRPTPTTAMPGDTTPSSCSRAKRPSSWPRRATCGTGSLPRTACRATATSSRAWPGGSRPGGSRERSPSRERPCCPTATAAN